MGKRILCIGDSNTWGYIPGSGERYEKKCALDGKACTDAWGKL